MTEELPHLEIYTDGGAKPNPGPGGWGAVYVRGRKILRELSGGEANTTNNRMELTGAAAALEALEAQHTVVLHTDSRYVQQGITEWIDGWRRKGWQTSERKPVLNRDLWERLDAALARHRVRWAWVRGHSGNPFNDRADRLATRAREQLQTRSAARAADPAPTAAAVEAVRLYAAAAFSGRTAEGSYAALLRFRGVEKVIAGRVAGSSANRMHLLSVVEGLRALTKPVPVEVITVSEYVRDGATKWIPGWRERDWRTRERKAVEHRDLWEEIDRLQGVHDVRWPLPGETDRDALEAAKSAAREAPPA